MTQGTDIHKRHEKQKAHRLILLSDVNLGYEVTPILIGSISTSRELGVLVKCLKDAGANPTALFNQDMVAATEALDEAFYSGRVYLGVTGYGNLALATHPDEFAKLPSVGTKVRTYIDPSARQPSGLPSRIDLALKVLTTEMSKTPVTLEKPIVGDAVDDIIQKLTGEVVRLKAEADLQNKIFEAQRTNANDANKALMQKETQLTKAVNLRNELKMVMVAVNALTEVL